MDNGIAMCTRPEKQKTSDSLPAITIFCFEVKKHQGRHSTNVYFGGLALKQMTSLFGDDFEVRGVRNHRKTYCPIRIDIELWLFQEQG